MILTYAPLVKFVAGRVGASLPAHVDEQDLVSYGLLGLIGAIERFDPEREIKFETFAMARIRARSSTSCARSTGCRAPCARGRGRSSARSHCSRRSSCALRPTRRSRKKLGVSKDELEDSLREISRYLGRGARRALVTVGWRRPDRPHRHDRGRAPARIPEISLELTEIKEALAEAISVLPEREKLVVTLYYYEELTLREIGEVLGVTESRVSQLHTKAILRLKAHLSGAQRETAET